MTQTELNRAVARATGETVDTIIRMGFLPLAAYPIEREPRTVDWDRPRHTGAVCLHSRRRRTPAPAFV